MTLSKTERRFLSLAHLDATTPLQKVAKSIRTSPSKLRYALHSLMDKGAIRVVPHINRFQLGYSDYHLFFTISAASASARNSFTNLFIKTPGVVFLAELGGDFQYEAIVSCRSALDASTLLDEVATKSRVDIRNKSVASNMSMYIFPKRYLADGVGSPLVGSMHLVSAGLPVARPTIDDLDSRILSLLSAHGETSLRGLGKELGISHATAQYRLDRLQKSGVLSGKYYDVEPLNYAYHDFVWQLSVSHSRAVMEKRLNEVVLKFPAVTYVASYFGQWDFEIGIEVAEPRLINPLIQKLSDSLGPEFISIRLMMRFQQLVLRHFPF